MGHGEWGGGEKERNGQIEDRDRVKLVGTLGRERNRRIE